jgi:transposase-like protein
MGKSNRKKFDLEFKRRIVQEYLSGTKSAKEIAEAEGLVTGQIYNWKTQLESRSRVDRIEEIQTTEGVSFEQARKIRELEEELEVAKVKIADQAMVIDLLKKIHPNLASEKRSNGYVAMRRQLDPGRGRSK